MNDHTKKAGNASLFIFLFAAVDMQEFE